MNRTQFLEALRALKSGESFTPEMIAYIGGDIRMAGSVCRMNDEGYAEISIESGVESRFSVVADDPIEVGERADEATQEEVTLSFSSENPVMRYGDAEILSHEKSDVNFKRLKSVGSVLMNHDPNQIIGRPTDIWLDEATNKGRMKMVFGTDAESLSARHKVVTDKTLRGVSVGYIVYKFLFLKDANDVYKGRIKGPAFVATRWEPLEVSLTPIAADPSVGVNRTLAKPKEEKTMDAPAVTVTAPETPANRAVETPVVDSGLATRAAQEAVTNERVRSASITALCDKHGVGASDRNELINSGATIEAAQGKVLDILAATSRAVGGRVTVTSDGVESFARAAVEGLSIRSGSLKAREAKHGGQVTAGLTLREMARESLARRNMAIPGDMNEMLRAALRGPSINQSDINAFLRGEMITGTTSDFPFILAATANKSMLAGYEAQITSFRDWCSITSLSDFKSTNRISLTSAGDLQKILEGGTYPQTALGESKNAIQIYSYGEKLNISRQAIINDDMGVFTTIPKKMGMSARRLPNILAVKALLSNPTLGDSIALFASGHNNLNGAAGNALDSIAHAMAGILKIDTMLSEQKGRLHAKADAESETLYLGLPLRKILVASREQAFYANTVLNSSANPSASNSGAANPLQNLATVVSEPLLKDSGITGYSATAYYGITDPNLAACIEVAFLNGVEEPFMEEVDQTDADGRIFKVRMDCGAAAVDYLGMVRENGV